MMRSYSNSIFLIFIMLCMVSCKKENMHASRLLHTEAFDKIEFNNPFDVFLTEGNAFSVEIVGAENTIENVSCSIENGVLSINNHTKFSWLSPKDNKIEIYIHSKALKEISANQTCNIRTQNAITSDNFGIILKSKANEANLELNCKNFYYWNNFPTGGKLVLSGMADKVSIWNYAIMSVDAKNLVSKMADVENSSNGDCEIQVLNSLKYSIKGFGNIHLYGNPAELIEMEHASSGKLIRH